MSDEAKRAIEHLQTELASSVYGGPETYKASMEFGSKCYAVGAADAEQAMLDFMQSRMWDGAVAITKRDYLGARQQEKGGGG